MDRAVIYGGRAALTGDAAAFGARFGVNRDGHEPALVPGYRTGSFGRCRASLNLVSRYTRWLRHSVPVHVLRHIITRMNP